MIPILINRSPAKKFPRVLSQNMEVFNELLFCPFLKYFKVSYVYFWEIDLSKNSGGLFRDICCSMTGKKFTQLVNI